MKPDEQQKQWREEFERFGYTAVQREHRIFPEPKRQFAFKWMHEQEQKKDDRDRHLLDWTKRGAYAAIVGAVAAVIGAIGAGIAAWPVIKEWIIR